MGNVWPVFGSCIVLIIAIMILVLFINGSDDRW